MSAQSGMRIKLPNFLSTHAELVQKKKKLPSFFKGLEKHYRLDLETVVNPHTLCIAAAEGPCALHTFMHR